MTENEVAKQIVDVAFNIHQTYGPGLLESVYEAIMAHVLRKRGLLVGRQQPIRWCMRMFESESDSART